MAARDQHHPMTVHGDMGEFEQLDILMYVAHANALETLTAQIDVAERFRQLLQHTEIPPHRSREPGKSGTL